MEDRSFTSCVLFFFFAPLIYPALPKAARRAAGIMRCCNEDPAYRPIGINRVHVQTNTPAFRSPWFSFQCGPRSDKAGLFAWMWLLVWSCGGGGARTGANLDKADSVYRGIAHVYVKVNAV